MKKNIILIVAMVVVIVLGSLLMFKDQTPFQAEVKKLKKENKILRVVAENRELKWKIQEYEKKLPQYQKDTKSQITPMFKGKEVKSADIIQN